MNIKYSIGGSMTDEQLKKITPEQKEQILAERARHERIATGNFIELDDFVKFFAQHGYKLDGYNTSINTGDFRMGWFKKFRDYMPELDGAFILIGDEEERKDIFDGFTCKSVINNPFVKYLEYSLTKFKIYKIVKNPEAEGFGGYDEPWWAYKLEKDLSKDWINYLALKDEDYVKYILGTCKEMQIKTPKTIENRKNLLAERIAELKAQTEKSIAEDQKELDRYNEIEQIIKSVKGDLQV